eukprot:gene10068-7038_t
MRPTPVLFFPYSPPLFHSLCEPLRSFFGAGGIPMGASNNSCERGNIRTMNIDLGLGWKTSHSLKATESGKKKLKKKNNETSANGRSLAPLTFLPTMILSGELVEECWLCKSFWVSFGLREWRKQNQILITQSDSPLIQERRVASQQLFFCGILYNGRSQLIASSGYIPPPLLTLTHAPPVQQQQQHTSNSASVKNRMSIPPPRGVSPGHQRLYNRTETPLKNSGRSRSRLSSIMLPPETPRSRSTATIGGRGGRRTGSVASQRSSAGMQRGRTGSAPPAIGGHTYVADVNPTFCVDGSVRCAEPINDRIAWTAEYDGTVRIRALPQGSELKQLEGRENTFCSALLYLEQYQRMWAAFNDGFIRIYEATTGRMIQEVIQHAGGVNCMVEMEGSVYTGGVDWKIGLWNPETSAFERLFFGHSGAVRSLCSYNGPSGSILFSGSDDGSIRAWDPYAPVQTEEDRACLHIFKGHDRAVLSLEALPHLSQLWSGGEDMTVRVWNLQTLEAVKVLKGHTAPVSSLLPVESRMWSGDKHGHIILWDINTLIPLQEITSRMQGAKLGMVLTMKKIQPSSCWKVWTSGSTGFVQCWNAETVPIVFDAKNQYKYGNRGVHELVQELESYIQALQDELSAAKEDAAMNYERGRMEVQRELMAHQLLQEENENLRNRLRQLEGSSAQPQGIPNELSMFKDSDLESPDTFHTPATTSVHHPASAAIFPPGNQYKGQIASSRHQRVVRGAQWPSLMAQRPHQIREMSKEEVCMAIGVPPAQISSLEVKPVQGAISAPSDRDGAATPRSRSAATDGGLSISCTVARPAEVSGEEVQRRLESFPFARLQQLHDNVANIPRGALDAAEERIRHLERQLQEAAGSANSSDAGQNNSAMQQELERLKDENDILRGMLDDTVESPRPTNQSDMAASQEFQKQQQQQEREHPSRTGPSAEEKEKMQQLSEELASAKDTIEYLKDVISEKEKQREALQKEVEQMRLDQRSDEEAADSTALTNPRNELVGMEESAEQDLQALSQITTLEKLLQESRRRGQAAAESMTALRHLVDSLRSEAPAQVTQMSRAPGDSGIESHTAIPGDTTRQALADITLSTDDPTNDSFLQHRVKRDTLERPLYPRWMDPQAFDKSPSPQVSRTSRRVHPQRPIPRQSSHHGTPQRGPPRASDSAVDLAATHAALLARVLDAEAVAASEHNNSTRTLKINGRDAFTLFLNCLPEMPLASIALMAYLFLRNGWSVILGVAICVELLNSCSWQLEPSVHLFRYSREDRRELPEHVRNVVDDLEALEDERKSLLQQNEELRETNEDLHAKAEDLTREVEKAQDEIDKLNEEVQSLEKENDQLKEALDEARQEEKRLKDKQTKLEDQLEDTKERAEELDRSLQESEDRLREVEEKIEKLERQLDDQRAVLEQTEDELDKARQHEEDLEKEVVDLRRSLKDATNDLEEVREELEESRSREEKTTRTVETLHEEIEVEVHRREKVERELEDAREMEEQLVGEKDQHKEALKNEVAKREKLEDEVEQSREIQRQLEDELTALESELKNEKDNSKSLKKDLDKMEQRVDQLQSTLDKTQDNLNDEKARRSDLERDLKNANQKNDQLQKDLNTQTAAAKKEKSEKEQLQRSLQESRSNEKALEKELSEAKKILKSEQSNREKLEKALNESDKKRQKAEKELEDTKKQLKEEKAQREQLQKKLDTAQQKEKANDKEIDNLNKALKKEKDERDKAERALKDGDKKRDKLEKDLDETKRTTREVIRRTSDAGFRSRDSAREDENVADLKRELRQERSDREKAERALKESERQREKLERELERLKQEREKDKERANARPAYQPRQREEPPPSSSDSVLYRPHEATPVRRRDPPRAHDSLALSTDSSEDSVERLRQALRRKTTTTTESAAARAYSRTTKTTTYPPRPADRKPAQRAIAAYSDSDDSDVAPSAANRKYGSSNLTGGVVTPPRSYNSRPTYNRPSTGTEATQYESLAAQNLALAVRLADAEGVIQDLRNSIEYPEHDMFHTIYHIRAVHLTFITDASILRDGGDAGLAAVYSNWADCFSLMMYHPIPTLASHVPSYTHTSCLAITIFDIFVLYSLIAIKWIFANIAIMTSVLLCVYLTYCLLRRGAGLVIPRGSPPHWPCTWYTQHTCINDTTFVIVFSYVYLLNVLSLILFKVVIFGHSTSAAGPNDHSFCAELFILISEYFPDRLLMSFARAPIRSSFNSSGGHLTRDPSPRHGDNSAGYKAKNVAHESGASPTTADSTDVEVERLHTLLAEQKMKLAVLEAGVGLPGGMDTSELEQYRTALEEIHELLASASPALSTRSDPNQTGSSPQKKKNEPLTPTSCHNVLRIVRDAALQQKTVISSLQRKNDANARLIRAMERELSQFRSQKNSSSPSKGEAENVKSFFIPTQKDLQKLQSKLDTLEKAHRESNKKLQSVQRDLERKANESSQLREELQRERMLVKVLKNTSEKEMLSVSSARRGSATPSQGGTPSKSLQRSPGKDRTSSSAVETTHHVRLFSGSDFAAAFKADPEAFKAAVMDDLCTALPILTDAVRYLDVRAGQRSVTLEVDIRHAASLSEMDIEMRLWTFEFSRVEALTDAHQHAAATLDAPETSHRSRNGSSAIEVLTQQLKESRQLIAASEAEVENLQQRLARSQQVQKDDTKAVDDTVAAVLAETESTILGLQQQLQEQDEAFNSLLDECEGLEKEVVALRAERQQLESLQGQVSAGSKGMVESLQTQVSLLQEELNKIAAEKQDMMEAADENLITSTAEIFEGCFPISSAEAAAFAATLLEDSDPAAVLHALLLHHAANQTGTVPLRVRRCAVDESKTAFKVRVELGYVCAAAEKSAVAKRIRHDMERAAAADTLVAPAEAYLRMAVARMDAVAAPGRLSISENKELTAVLQELLSTKERLATPGTTEQLALVGQKYKEMEAAVQKGRIESVQAATRLRVKDNENERLRQEIKELKAEVCRSAEMSDRDAAAADIIAQLEHEVRSLKKDLDEAQGRSEGQDMLIAEQNQLVETLHQQVEEYAAAAEQATTHAMAVDRNRHTGAVAGSASPGKDVHLLQVMIDKGAKEKERLVQQIKDLEVDMNDLINIQHSLQEEIEQTQRKLRASHNEKEELRQRVAQLLAEKKQAQRVALNGSTEEVSKILQQSISLLRHNISKASTAAGVRPEVLVPRLAVQQEPQGVIADGNEDVVSRATTELYSLAQQLGTVIDPLVEVATPRISQKSTTARNSADETEQQPPAPRLDVASRLAATMPGSRYAAWAASRSGAGTASAAGSNSSTREGAASTRSGLLELANRRYASARAAASEKAETVVATHTKVSSSSGASSREAVRNPATRSLLSTTDRESYLGSGRRTNGSGGEDTRSSSSRVLNRITRTREDSDGGYRRTSSRGGGADGLPRRGARNLGLCCDNCRGERKTRGGFPTRERDDAFAYKRRLLISLLLAAETLSLLYCIAVKLCSFWFVKSLHNNNKEESKYTCKNQCSEIFNRSMKHIALMRYEKAMRGMQYPTEAPLDPRQYVFFSVLLYVGWFLLLLLSPEARTLFPL